MSKPIHYTQKYIANKHQFITVGSNDTMLIPSIVSQPNVTAMTIIPGGNVGIGTTNPLVKLDVNGVMRGTTASFHVTSSHVGATSGQYTIITGSATNGYNTTLHNTGLWNGSTGYVTAPIAGYYMFSYSVYQATGTNITTLRKNATAYNNGTEYASTGAVIAASTSSYGSASAIIYLAVGDTVSIWHGASAALTTNNPSNYFCGQLIMPA